MDVWRREEVNVLDEEEIIWRPRVQAWLDDGLKLFTDAAIRPLVSLLKLEKVFCLNVFRRRTLERDPGAGACLLTLVGDGRGDAAVVSSVAADAGQAPTSNAGVAIRVWIRLSVVFVWPWRGVARDTHLHPADTSAANPRA
jgi:hypothetical protein